jgi:diacylglycerol kinase (ATP)
LPYAQLIINPSAGAGKTARKWPEIKEILRNSGLEFEYAMTQASGHAIDLAKSAAKSGCKMVVSVGGDGTISEVVQGLFQANCLKDIMLGIISSGTGADYIRSAGIPRSIPVACQLLLKPKTRPLDVGVIEFYDGNKRLFVNFAGLGFATDVVKATTQKYKALGAMPSYLLGLLSTLISYQNQEISITIGERTEERKTVTVLISNGKYAGGGMMTTPHADLSDGLFDVLIVDNMTKADLLFSVPRIYNGTHLTHPKVLVKKVKEIKINSKDKICIQADGDIIGESPARFYVLPGALNLIV